MIEQADKPVTPWEYMIIELPNTVTTDEMLAQCNTLGAEGWEMIRVGAYGSTPDHFRMWFKR